jgi:hypothetical protein
MVESGSFFTLESHSSSGLLSNKLPHERKKENPSLGQGTIRRVELVWILQRNRLNRRSICILTHLVMEAGLPQDLHSTSWKATDILPVQVQRPRNQENQWQKLQFKSGDLRAKSADGEVSVNIWIWVQRKKTNVSDWGQRINCLLFHCFVLVMPSINWMMSTYIRESNLLFLSLPTQILMWSRVTLTDRQTHPE